MIIALISSMANGMSVQKYNKTIRMKSLFETIKESLLDAEDTDYTPYLNAKAYAEENYQKGYYDVSFDGVITLNSPLVSVNVEKNNLPEGIKFAGTYRLSLRSCDKIDMSVFGGTQSEACFESCNFKGFTGEMEHRPSRHNFTNCVGDNTKWMGKENCGMGTRYMRFENCTGKWDFTDWNTSYEAITVSNSNCTILTNDLYELCIDHSNSSNIFDNIKSDYKVLKIYYCNNIKNLKGISRSVQQVFMSYCRDLESLQGLDKTEAYSLSFSECPNLDNSDYLPATLSSIVAHGNHMCWNDNEIAQKYPHISSIKGTPLHKIDPTLGGKVKVGAYGAVRSAAHSHSQFGSSRGSLVLDRIKKISKTVIWEKCKSRSYDDFEIMDDNANPKKNWDYVDPNGFNDCTGVGIEVGDEVVVYCSSGSYGKSNGVSRDVVLGFTPKMVKTKDNGNRPACDICILRPHKIAEEFFDN